MSLFSSTFVRNNYHEGTIPCFLYRRTFNFQYGMNCLLWLLASFVMTNAKQCKEKLSARGSYLKGHVISSGNAANIGECLVKCASEPRCKSINFRFGGLFCELNDADRSTHPWDYGPREGHAYSDYPYQTPQVRFAVNRAEI